MAMRHVSGTYELSVTQSDAEGETVMSRPAVRVGLPLSFAQQRLWFMDQLEPGNSQCNVSLGARLRGLLSIAVLQQAVQEIVCRHEALRTVFSSVDGKPVQEVRPEAEVPVVIIDRVEVPVAERDAHARSIADAEWSRPFDLARGPLARVAVVRFAQDEHCLLVTAQQIVFDGSSRDDFIRELVDLYGAFTTGKPSGLPELRLQYADFALWQRDTYRGKVLQEQIEYWRRKLAGAPDVLRLPTDHPRPAVQRLRAHHQEFVFSASLAESLRELSEIEGAALAAVLMSAFQVLLYRYSGQEDMVLS